MKKNGGRRNLRLKNSFIGDKDLISNESFVGSLQLTLFIAKVSKKCVAFLFSISSKLVNQQRPGIFFLCCQQGMRDISKTEF
jgi:hypothetical protein